MIGCGGSRRKSLIAGTLGLLFGCAAAFGQGAPNATGFTGNPWQQVGQHMAAGGNPPVLSGTNCGQAGAPATGVQPGSTDMAGTLINGSGGGSCLITFFQPWNNAPTCIVQDVTTPTATVQPIVTRLSFTLTAIVSGDIIRWICIGQAGG